MQRLEFKKVQLPSRLVQNRGKLVWVFSLRGSGKRVANVIMRAISLWLCCTGGDTRGVGWEAAKLSTLCGRVDVWCGGWARMTG
jgi:hypothetical protein